MKKKFSLIICGAGNKDSQISKTEINFYEKIFGSNNFKIDQSNRNQFPSYKNIYKSWLANIELFNEYHKYSDNAYMKLRLKYQNNS